MGHSSTRDSAPCRSCTVVKRYLLYAAAYGLVGVVIGLGMAYYTKDVANASVLLNPNGTPRVVSEPSARERVQPEPEPVREDN